LTPALAHRLHKLSGKPVDRCRLVSGEGSTAHQLGNGRRLVGQELVFDCLSAWKKKLVHVLVPNID
jgi:hypothetical protein